MLSIPHATSSDFLFYFWIQLYKHLLNTLFYGGTPRTLKCWAYPGLSDILVGGFLNTVWRDTSFFSRLFCWLILVPATDSIIFLASSACLPTQWRIGILDMQGCQLTLVIPLFLAIKCQDTVYILSMGKASLLILASRCIWKSKCSSPLLNKVTCTKPYRRIGNIFKSWGY